MQAVCGRTARLRCAPTVAKCSCALTTLSPAHSAVVCCRTPSIVHCQRANYSKLTVWQEAKFLTAVRGGRSAPAAKRVRASPGGRGVRAVNGAGGPHIHSNAGVGSQATASSSTADTGSSSGAAKKACEAGGTVTPGIAVQGAAASAGGTGLRMQLVPMWGRCPCESCKPVRRLSR